MNVKRFTASVVAGFVGLSLLCLPVRAAEPAPELAILKPFIGTWQSVSGAVDGSKGFSDVSRWEWILKGQVVRITHNVNNGAYAGESLIHWDAQQQKIIYRYVTTAGFYTDGVITPADGGGLDIHEFVRGATSGPTETQSHYRLGDDGRIHAWSKFMTDGSWGQASNVTYDPAPDAQVNLP